MQFDYQKVVKTVQEPPMFEQPLSAMIKSVEEQNELDQKTVQFATICRDCVFAEFTDDFLKQTGCALNRLDKFKEQNLIAEETDEETGVEYFKIKRICNACRNQDWASKYEDPLEKIKQDIVTLTELILLASDNDEENLNSLQSFISQTIRPSRVILLFKRRTKSTDSLSKLLLSNSIKYEIVNVVEDASISRLIDHAVRRCNKGFYIICEAGKSIPVNSIEKLDKLINIELRQISMIRPLDKNLTGLTVAINLHRLIGGNNNIPVWEKIAELATNQNTPHMIKEWDEI